MSADARRAVVIIIGCTLLVDLASVSVALGTPGNWAWWRIGLVFWPIGLVIGAIALAVWESRP